MSNFKSIAWNDLQDDFKDSEFAYEFGEGVRDFYRKQGADAEQERIIKQLREKAVDLMRISESIDEDEYMNAGDSDAPYWGSFALNDFADALIKGEK